MNTMHMPGFTAEASLCKMRDYREIAEFGGTSENLVVPAFAKECRDACTLCGATDLPRSCAACGCCAGLC